MKHQIARQLRIVFIVSQDSGVRSYLRRVLSVNANGGLSRLLKTEVSDRAKLHRPLQAMVAEDGRLGHAVPDLCS